MKKIDLKSALIGVFFTTTAIFSLGATGKKESPFTKWWKEHDRINKKWVAEDPGLNGTAYDEEFRAANKESSDAYDAFVKHIRASNDERLKLLDSKSLYANYIVEAYWDLAEAQESKIQQTLTKAKIGRYRSIIKQIDTMLSEEKPKKE